MSKAWPKVRLGDVLKLDLDRVPIDASVSYPMVGVLSFGRGLFDREPIENGQTSYKHFHRLKAEHVVMSQLFGWEGALALSDNKFSGKYLSPQFPTFSCISDRLDRQFLGWLMRRKIFWDELGSRTSGMGDRRRTLNPEALFACEIPLPPLKEQRRIVAKIEELATQIQEARAFRRQSAEEVEMLMNYAVEKSFSTFISEVFLEDVCSLITDGTHQTPRYVEDGYRFLSAQNIKPFRFMPEQHRQVAFEDYRSCSIRVKPKKGDILLTRVGAGIGEAAMIDYDIDFAFYVSLALIRPYPEIILPEFLVQWLNSPCGRAQSRRQTLGKDHSQGNLNLKLLRGFQIPLPNLSEQHRIVAELNALQAEWGNLKHLQAKTTAELDALLPAILDRAFKGEI